MSYPKQAAVFKVVSSKIDMLVPVGAIIEGVVVCGRPGDYIGFEARVDEPSETNGSHEKDVEFRWFMAGGVDQLVKLEPLTEHARALLNTFKA